MRSLPSETSCILRRSRGVLCHFTEPFCQDVLTEETKRAEEERKGEKARERDQEAPLGEACLSEEKEPKGCRDRVKP